MYVWEMRRVKHAEVWVFIAKAFLILQHKGEEEEEEGEEEEEADEEEFEEDDCREEKEIWIATVNFVVVVSSWKTRPLHVNVVAFISVETFTSIK